MGLDVWFEKVTREDLVNFRKVNFILTYFDVSDEQNCEDIPISKDMLGEFVADLKCELVQYKERIKNSNDADGIELPPINPKLMTKEIPFGGITSYTPDYWEDVKWVYGWAQNQLNEFDWENAYLVLHCWW